jgi:hypothetical protein
MKHCSYNHTSFDIYQIFFKMGQSAAYLVICMEYEAAPKSMK